MQVLPIAAGLALSLLAAAPLLALRDSVVADRVATLTRASSWTLERGDSHDVPGPPSAGPGQNRRPAVLLVGGGDDAPAPRRRRRRDSIATPAGASAICSRPRWTAGSSPTSCSGKARCTTPAASTSTAATSGAGRGVSAEQPIDRLPRRSDTRKAVEVFRFGDHLGGVACNTDDHTLHAVSWGSRWIYRFALDRSGARRTLTHRPPRCA